MKILLSCFLLSFYLSGSAQERPPASPSLLYSFHSQKNSKNYTTLSMETYHTIAAADADKKASKARRHKRAGITLTCIGGLFLAGAITTGVLSTGKNTNDLETRNLILRGAALGSGALSGVFIGIGLPLTIVGTHRIKKYNE